MPTAATTVAAKVDGALPPHPPLMKGYLPVRLRFTSAAVVGGGGANRNGVNGEDDGDDGDDNIAAEADHSADTTFFYVKQHHAGDATLFVANCPAVPRVRTSLLLRAVFSRGCDGGGGGGGVTRVTVVPHPRRLPSSASIANDDANTDNVDYDAYDHGCDGSDHYRDYCRWTTNKKLGAAALLRPNYQLPYNGGGGEGKFAHVVFSSARAMKRALHALSAAPKTTSSSPTPAAHQLLLTLDRAEWQALVEDTDRQWRKDSADDDDDDDISKNNSVNAGGVLKMAARYRASLRQRWHDRATLRDECDAVVRAYEAGVQTAEEDAGRRRHEPDAEGFVLVQAGSATPTATTAGHSRSGGRPRHHPKRRKTTSATAAATNAAPRTSGADPLPDFYRFQTRERRHTALHELRRRFDEDRATVRRLKEERQYRPFK